ncbi:MAG: hypothetical protein WBI18_01075 [Candidatus Saccharicenans sp.]
MLRKQVGFLFFVMIINFITAGFASSLKEFREPEPGNLLLLEDAVNLRIFTQEEMLFDNEKKVHKFWRRYPGENPAGLIEEIIGGNQYALIDILSNLKDKGPYGNILWYLKYKLPVLLRIKPSWLMEIIVDNNINLKAEVIDFFMPDQKIFGRSASIYLLKERIKALEKVKQPELMKVRDAFLNRAQELLSELGRSDEREKQYFNEQADSYEQLKKQCIEHVGSLPESIIKKINQVEICPCPENIHELLDALKNENEAELARKLMTICPNEVGATYVFIKVVELLWEESLCGNEEAVEILLICYCNSDRYAGEAVDLALLALLRHSPDFFLRLIRDNMHLFYTCLREGYPLDSSRTLYTNKEVRRYLLIKRIEALMKVQDKDLIKIRDACISQLKARIKEINLPGSLGFLCFRTIFSDNCRALLSGLHI